MQLYRTYDRQWNRTGYSPVAQYAGQVPLDGWSDFLPCQCGAPYMTIGKPTWLAMRYGESVPTDLILEAYVAKCAKGHWSKQEKVIV